MFQTENKTIMENLLSKMPCHITDDIDREYEEFNDPRINAIGELSLYDLMSQDFDVWLTENKTFGFDLEIIGEDGDITIHEKGLHPYAVEGFADFCRRFVYQYDKACNRFSQTEKQRG